MTDYLTLSEAVEMLDLETPEEVADLLRSAGAQQIDGTSRSCGCPVSVFVAEAVGGSIVSTIVSIHDDWARMDPWSRHFPTPVAASQFICRFDNDDSAFDDLRSPGELQLIGGRR